MSTIVTAIIGAVMFILAIAGVFLKGKQAGKDSAVAEQAKQNKKRVEKFNEVDSKAPDFGASISRLRDRAKR